MRMGPVASVILIILGFRKTFAASLPTLRAQPPLIRRAIILTAGLVIALAGRADAVTMGDHFTVIFTETLPTPGAVATADITLGPPAGPLFSISGFTAISGTGVCLTCGLTSEVLTAVFFDGATSGLTGNLTGTFLGGSGGRHSFDLALTNLPGATWFFTDNHLDASPPFTDTARGTYRTVVASGVPEPSTLLLLSSALAALAAWRRGSKPGTSCR
jgi:hypothetical protein